MDKTTSTSWLDLSKEDLAKVADTSACMYGRQEGDTWLTVFTDNK